MWYFLYNAVLLLATPVILCLLLAKKRCRRGLPQRFGFARPPIRPDERPLVWIHAVSLGEVVAVTPLVKELHRRHPDYRFAVSTVTETGREAVEQRLRGVAEHCYAPLDFPWVVSCMIRHLRPVLYLFVETELWPNLLRSLHRSGIPTVLVNGRLSSRSFARQQWEPVRSFYRSMLETLSLCLMQSDRDAERIIALGADAKVVKRTGNIKFDQPAPESVDSRSVRSSLGLRDGEQLIVAGSTHPGEEEALVDAYRSLAEHHPSLLLLLAPRHIERAEQVEAMVRARGVSVRRRTAMKADRNETWSGPRVILLDSRGELATLYREAVVAFVGGTLVPVGGHNLLEPALWGKPVLFGPYTDHCAEIAGFLLQAGGGVRVTGEELAKRIGELLDRPDEGARIGVAARSVVEQNRGALKATVDAVDDVLRAAVGTRRPAPAPDSLPLMAGR
ncbi:3-deoxy-D-manno-octulosonic-acid transferase [Nitrospira japonica]|uniref:3-deoxy-D-manno-octulosonic acid transferase n=2 Tax=Nitrospira japonica TaxID=1325564 RepID=A0A1W1I011_9BACT|nr:3-deoxy-D-manno-octulosonic-acid transferase [Nitrospira japonica]